MSNAAEKVENRRSVPRQRVLKSAKIAFANFLYVIDVMVRDVSDSGARIRLISSEPIPETFHIIFSETKMICEAHIAWRKGRDVGVAFDGPLQLMDAKTDPRLRRFSFMI